MDLNETPYERTIMPITARIRQKLQENPGTMLATPTKLYALVDGVVLSFTGADFSLMDEKQLNDYVIETLAAA